MRILVVAETENGEIRQGSLAALGFSQQVGGADAAQLLLIGDQLDAAAASAARFAPTLCAQSAALANPVADRHAAVIAQVVKEQGFELVVAASTTYAKDVVARATALVDGAMASDVVAFEKDGEGLVYQRPMYAGAVLAKVRLHGSPQVVTVRPSAFELAIPAGSPCEVTQLTVDEAALPSQVEFVGLESHASGRPDVTEANVVISGGRGLKNSEDFERLVGGLADCFSGATGSSRALVDAGITPNDLQVGQTGKIVAPDLYVAIGISGAVQHLAGMKNSKCIVAINNDPDAPIFEVADYGLVGDLYEIVPELTEKLSGQLSAS